MTVDEARVRLQEAGFVIAEEKRFPNETGTQLKVDGQGFSSVSVDVYDIGIYYVQGNNKAQVDSALSQSPPADTGKPGSSTFALANPALSVSPRAALDPGPAKLEQKKIFVVHGHDNEARMELELALHQLGLEPFVLANKSGGGLTIIEALEKEIGPGADRIRFGIVLLTPDDMGYSKAGGPDNAQPRARQNVVLEMGMLISAIGRQNVAILLKGNLEIPSDADGILHIQFQSHVKETITKLCDHLMQAGFQLESANIIKAANSA